MKDLLTFFDDDVALFAKVGCGYSCLWIGHLCVVDGDAALFDEPACFAV